MTARKRKVKARVMKHPQWKAREVHSLFDMKGPLTCWTIYPDQLEAMVEQMAKAMVKARDPYLSPKLTPEMMAERFAKAALAAIGIITAAKPARR